MIRLTEYMKYGQEITLGEVTIYFSYETPVAYRFKGNLVVRVNDGSKMTGKHLNALDEGTVSAKKDRVPGEVFESRLDAVLTWGIDKEVADHE